MAKTRLDSWKAIAEYLKRSPRTVQRWHEAFGLPVHHFRGGKGPVFSYSDELDGWLSGFVEEGDERASTNDLLVQRRQRSAELTMQADELWELRSEDNLVAISALYRNAVDQNPLNGPAFIGLANSIALSALVGVARASAAYPRAAEALQRASRLGLETPQARCAAAWLQMVYERRWKRAQDGFDSALDRQPDSSHALAGRALLYVAKGDLGAARESLLEAWKKNPFVSLCSALVAWVQYLSGDAELAAETIVQSRTCGEIGPFSAAVEALALIQPGPVAPTLARVEDLAAAHPASLVIQGALGYAFAVSDRAGRAREMLHSLDRMKGDSHYPTALVLIGLGERHQALTCLDSSYMEGSLWSLGFRFDPILEPLRNDSHSAARLRRLGPSG